MSSPLPTASGVLRADMTRSAPAPGQALSMRRTLERLHDKLAAALPVVGEMALSDQQFCALTRTVTAAMVSVELATAVLGDDRNVPTAVFNVPMVDDKFDGRPVPTANGQRADRTAWEQLFALRRSATGACGLLNRGRVQAAALGMSTPQTRVLIAGVLAVGHLIEAIGSLRVPDEFFELAG